MADGAADDETHEFQFIRACPAASNIGVEATISLSQVSETCCIEHWSNGLSVPFLVVEMNKCPSLVGVDHKKVVVLLSFGDWKVPAVGDGVVELSSRVVSAGVDSKLKVSVRAW